MVPAEALSSARDAALADVYISAAVNRICHVADWANAPRSTLAFAAHKSIAIWSRPAEPDSPQLTHLVTTGFPKPITALKFHTAPSAHTTASITPLPSASPLIVAGAGDGSLGLWRVNASNDADAAAAGAAATSRRGPHWIRTALVKEAHSGSVSAIGVLRPTSDPSTVDQRSSVFVTGASDSLLKVWSIASTADGRDEVKLVQTIDLGGRFPLDVALLQLPATDAGASPSLLMAVSTTTRKIDLFASQPSAAAPATFSHKLSIEGHEDWVKSLDFCNTRISGDDGAAAQDVVMLASGSQDSSVRLWKFARADDVASATSDRADLATAPQERKADEFETMVSKIESDMTKADGEISTKAQYFDVGSGRGTGVERWAVTFDALLIGHDNWVTGVRWHPVVEASGGRRAVQPAALLTSSADNSLILWTPTGSDPGLADDAGADPTSIVVSPFPIFNRSLVSTGGARRTRGPLAHHVASSIWLPSQRFGEVGGASNLGFFGALWRPSTPGAASRSEAVMAHGWGGGTHVWSLDASDAGGRAMSAPAQWQIANPVTGHFGPAKSVAWEPCGEYFLSCSVDQTTRLHARPGSSSAASSTDEAPATWYEIARPQSHGYDLHSVSWLDRLNFVSAADEKVLRVFSAPRGFVGSVGPRGLNCAALGSEEESRLGLRALHGHRYLLALHDDRGELAACAVRHGDLMRQAADRACYSEEGNLTAVVVSDKFERIADNGNEQRYSFKQLETYLKWMYAQAWAVGIKRGRLFVDINVLLVPSSKLDVLVPPLAAVSDHVLVDGAAIDALRPSFDGARVAFETIASDKPADAAAFEAASAAVHDDGKGFQVSPVVALGGTFDHLHAGHKILLSMAALVAGERLIVGITTDEMLAKKSNAHLLETLEQRRARVETFISLFRAPFAPLKQEVVPLLDVAGPAGTDADVDALVLTEETISGAVFIDNVRREKGLPPLHNWIIGVLGSEGETNLGGDAKVLAESKIGSTAIRRLIRAREPRHAEALTSLLRSRRYQLERLASLMSSASWSSDAPNGSHGDADLEARPVGASVPPLGLSNRAVFEGSKVTDGPSESGQPIGAARESLSAVLRRPPTEEQLSVETLWPELDKLYGHGYELLWLSANPSDPIAVGVERGKQGGRFVASCCRATKAEHAVVRIHDRERNWKEVATLPGHESSVSRIRWSLDSRFVVSVSKDRSWRVFEKTETKEGEVAFVPFTGERSHARIIWDASFNQNLADPYVFATASRDKMVKIWRLLPPLPVSSCPDDAANDDLAAARPYELLQTLSFGQAATAVTFGHGSTLAVGLEDGSLCFYAPSTANNGAAHEWVEKVRWRAAEEQINEVAFQPPTLDDNGDALVAVACQDGLVRVARISHL